MTVIAETSFCIRSWAAWLPGVETRAEWEQWAVDQRCAEVRAISLKQIPAPMRRRLSMLGKMILSCAEQLVEMDQELPVIFCSQHGEIVRSEALLAEVYQQEALSPNNFSMSVHNSTAGLYSIIAGNHASMTAIAAGKHSFESRIIEAIATLHAHASDEVLLLIGEESPGPYFSSVIAEEQTPYGMALLLSLKEGDKISCRFEDEVEEGLGAETKSAKESTRAQLPSGLQFLRWLLDAAESTTISQPAARSVWQRLPNKSI